MPAAVHPGEDVPMRVRRVAVPLLVAGIVALLFGACGDDGDGETGTGEDSTSREESSTSTTAPEIGVVKTYDDLSQEHVAVGETVDYPQIPPVGGTHWEAWQDCGVYDEPIRSEAAVHSMEHGAVWITYRPDLPDGDVEELEDFFRRQPLVVVTVKGVRRDTNERYILMSPFPGLPAPIVISSWAHQLRLDSPDDPRLQRYVDTFRVSEKYSPEYGPTCKGQPEPIGGRPAFD
jgi:hypothetical protein